MCQLVVWLVFCCHFSLIRYLVAEEIQLITSAQQCVCLPTYQCSEDQRAKTHGANVSAEQSCAASQVCCLRSASLLQQDRPENGGREKVEQIVEHNSLNSHCVCVQRYVCQRGVLEVSELAALNGSVLSASRQCDVAGRVCCPVLCSCVASHRCPDVALVTEPDTGLCGPGQVCCSRNSTLDLDVSKTSAESFLSDPVEHRRFCEAYPLSISCTVTRQLFSKPTINESSNFDPEQDADILRKSFGIGLGASDTLTSILTRRTFRQRDIIAQTYLRKYHRDLYNDASFWTVGLTENTIQQLLIASSPTEYQAIALDRAMSGPGTDENTVIEVLSTGTAQQLALISRLFYNLTGNSLESRIEREFSGPVRDILLSMVMQRRDGGSLTDRQAAKLQAQQLFKAGEAVLGTDESVFVSLLTRLNWAQLSLVMSEYRNLTGQCLERAIAGEFSGDLRQLLTAIVHVSRNVPRYFAERLGANLRFLQREDEDLIRILVWRSEIDLATILHEYQLIYNVSLADSLKWKTVGSYENILLALIRA